MFAKIMAAIVISVVSVITTLIAQSVIGSHGISAAGKPHQAQATRQACKVGRTVGFGHGVSGTVSTVSGNTITITTPAGKTVTVNVSSSTMYRGESGASSLSAIQPGTVIIVRGTAGSNNSVNATEIAIVPPHAAGKVTGISGSTLTVQPPSGDLGKLASSVTTVVTNSNTQYFAPGSASANLSTIKVGTYIAATGTLNSGGKSLTATRIIIAPSGFNLGNGTLAPHFMGRGMLRGMFHGMRTGGPFGFHRFWMNTSAGAQSSTGA